MADIDEVVKNMPRRGMSQGCQRYIPHVVKMYLSGENSNYALMTLDKRDKSSRGYIQDIYHKLDEFIRPNSLRLKIAESASTTQIPRELLREDEEHTFAEVVIKYLSRVSKRNKLKKIFSNMNSSGNNLTAHVNGESRATRKDFVKLARNPEFYGLIREVLSEEES